MRAAEEAAKWVGSSCCRSKGVRKVGVKGDTRSLGTSNIAAIGKRDGEFTRSGKVKIASEEVKRGSRRKHGGRIMKEDSWREDNEGRTSEEASGNISGYLGSIWKHLGSIWGTSGGASGGIWEVSCKHLGGNSEASGKHLGASGRQEVSRGSLIQEAHLLL